MKKLIVTIVALSLFVGVSGIFAQTSGLVGKGIKVGLNMGKFTGDDAPDDAKMYMGFAAGGYITYAFNDLFAVQPELQFTMKGSAVEVGDETYKTKLSYIEIPILAKVMLSGTDVFKPNFYVGPGIGFLMSAKAEDEDIKDDMKSMDIGLIGGVGFDYLLSSSKITFDVRYEAGLTSLDDTEDEAKIKNSTISFLVGYGF